jgi:hypothetical protein
MKLIQGWRDELNRLWSVRVAIFMALLASADQILALFNMFIPPIWYAVLSMLVIVARITAQAPAKDANATKPTL